MGSGMGARVHEASDPIVAYDRDADRLADGGLIPAASVGELVADVDVVLMSLPDSTIIEQVVLGEDGVRAHARAGQVVVDLSTGSPESTQRIHGALAEQGVAYLDAGISGGAKAAEAGTLTISAVRPRPWNESARCSSASPPRSSTWATAAPAT